MARKSITDLEHEVLSKIGEIETVSKKLQDAIDSPEKRVDMRMLDLTVVKKKRELEQLKKRLKKRSGKPSADG